MATWPASLPQYPDVDGYEDQPQDSVLRSSFDGYTKQRNRFTAVLHTVSERYVISKTQFDTFKTFYFSTLSNGALEFDKPDYESGTDRLYKFTGPYSREFLSNDLVRLTVNLEKLP
jgi:hypothetical protein